MRPRITTLATPKRLGGNTLENRSWGQCEDPAWIPFGPLIWPRWNSLEIKL
ncbi:hypothetical protein Pan241w_52960 [Gimesia alba]|uniref:Uncharacterized protein n=1 Tax=Gimesia alba TaxID=2527973 RepID=A0A517RMR4_9PLAN|nr:hypothetical protein Pan241w_52960 [Gimesia alba]